MVEHLYGRKVLDLNSVAAASHVELLVNGFQFFPEKVNLLIGEQLEDVLKKVHFVVKRFHLRVTQDDVRESWQNW